MEQRGAEVRAWARGFTAPPGGRDDYTKMILAVPCRRRPPLAAAGQTARLALVRGERKSRARCRKVRNERAVETRARIFETSVPRFQPSQCEISALAEDRPSLRKRRRKRQEMSVAVLMVLGSRYSRETSDRVILSTILISGINLKHCHHPGDGEDPR